jgi:hypothetical protein
MKRIAFLTLLMAVGLSAAENREITKGRVNIGTGVSIHYLQSGPPEPSRALVLIPGWCLPALPLV